MKFKDIRNGDIVYIRVSVDTGIFEKELFWIPSKVDKVTPKRFMVGSKYYGKETGLCIGRYGECAAMIGDKSFGELVEDQTDERNALIKDLRKVAQIKDIMLELKINHKHEKLDEIYICFKKIKSLLG